MKIRKIKRWLIDWLIQELLSPFAFEGDVVFSRSRDGDDDEHLWDDTELIKAYDNAINLMKDEIVKR